MKKRLLIFGCVLVLGFIPYSHCFALPKPLNKFIDDASVYQRVADYFSSHNLMPYVEGGSGEFIVLGYEEEVTYRAHVYTGYLKGQVVQDNRSYNCLFAVKYNMDRKDWDMNLLYLSDKMWISPRLLEDVLNTAYTSQLISNLPESAHLCIEELEQQEKAVIEKWSFFNIEPRQEFYVMLTSDEKGGTYFTLFNKKRS